MKKRTIKYLTGTIALAALLAGCEDADITSDQAELDNYDKNVQATTGVLVVLQETAEGGYQILDESPCSVTKIVVKKLDGSTQVLNESQAKELFAKDKAAHPGDYSNVNSNWPIWWMLWNSNYGYGLGRTYAPAPSFSRYYVHPATYQKAEFFSPAAAKKFTGSAKTGLSSAARSSVVSAARSGASIGGGRSGFGGGFGGGGGM